MIPNGILNFLEAGYSSITSNLSNLFAVPETTETGISSELQVMNSNNSIIKKIQDYKSNNVQTNLFIGRSSTEPLPEAVINTVWVSLSIDRSQEIRNETANDRLHLIMNCNNNEQMKTIQSLFNLVVVDLSTRKFFDDNGLSNIYNSVQHGGKLLIELCLRGGALVIPDQVSYVKAQSVYSEKLTVFVVQYFQKNFNIVLDVEKISGNIMYDIQVTARKELVSNVEEYKNWRSTQGHIPKLNELLLFFEYLIEKNEGIISPSSILTKEQMQSELQKRKDEMSKCFKEVDICNEIYPYSNNYDAKGQIKIQFFQASNKI